MCTCCTCKTSHAFVVSDDDNFDDNHDQNHSSQINPNLEVSDHAMEFQDQADPSTNTGLSMPLLESSEPEDSAEDSRVSGEAVLAVESDKQLTSPLTPTAST